MIRAAIIVLASLICAAASAQPVVPDAAITPGALNPAVTQATIGETICQFGWTRSVRPSYAATHEIKRRLLTEMHRQGYAVGMQDVELDHLVPLALGGAPDAIENLWLEPRAGTEWNATRKDDLEAVLPRLVCTGRISLSEAQRAIADDWTVAWEKYIGAGQ